MLLLLQLTYTEGAIPFGERRLGPEPARMQNMVIAGYARSPFHLAGKGGLARVRPDDLAAQVIRGLLERTGVNPADIEDVIVG